MDQVLAHVHSTTTTWKEFSSAGGDPQAAGELLKTYIQTKVEAAKGVNPSVELNFRLQILYNDLGEAVKKILRSHSLVPLEECAEASEVEIQQPQSKTQKYTRSPRTPNSKVDRSKSSGAMRSVITKTKHTSTRPEELPSALPKTLAHTEAAVTPESPHRPNSAKKLPDETKSWFKATEMMTTVRKLTNECEKWLEEVSVAFKAGADYRVPARALFQAHSELKKEFQDPLFQKHLDHLTFLYTEMIMAIKNMKEDEFLLLKQKISASLQTITHVTIQTITNHPKEEQLSEQYTYITLVYPQVVQTDFPPVIKNTKSSFIIEPEKAEFQRSSYTLNIVNDVYAKEFQNSDHFKFIRQDLKKKENFIIVVREDPSRMDGFPMLVIGKKGHEERIISTNLVSHPKLSTKVLKYLQSMYPEDNIMQIKDPNYLAPKDIAKIEGDSPQVKKEITIGVIYAKEGQTNPLEMFANKTSEAFEKFLVIMGMTEPEIKWQHVTIIAHVSPKLNSEQHRRCVGNAPAIIFFMDEGDSFDASDVGQLGMVPQIFIVVQRHKYGYRVGFFHSGNLKPFGPDLGKNYFFQQEALRDLLYTKIFNGNMMFFYCSPMNRAFTLTRSTNIDLIIQNYHNKVYEKQ
eukprot:TRINITY_DN19488_c0_g1_i1.p1 TRINITY_DN19488_c0_g1~~TRINITY_DN19488_c0_g1_i1.p1  ORF type:complete len:685 (-),score=139.97 TRINITY_DN19488_c0_g1_i1:30-1916(-)